MPTSTPSSLPSSSEVIAGAGVVLAASYEAKARRVRTAMSGPLGEITPTPWTPCASDPALAPSPGLRSWAATKGCRAVLPDDVQRRRGEMRSSPRASSARSGRGC